MSRSPSAKALLHVFLLTYNRQKSLRRTLEAIAASALVEHPLTVMDNCSIDETPAVCAEFRPLLPRMTVLRHERNIGFGANYLRSIEISTGEYTWILCDDDTLFPERVPALIEMLETNGPEACFTGGPRQDEWPAGPRVLPSEIQRRCRTFLTGQSFVPALAFKSSLVESRELVAAYFGIRTNFPQLILGKKLFIEDIPCAVLRPPILRRDDPEEKLPDALDIIDGWSAFCRSLPPALQTESFYSIFVQPTLAGMVKQLLRMIAWAKIEGGTSPSYFLVRMGANVSSPSVRIGLGLCLLACLPPRRAYHLARETYRKVKYGWLRRPLPATYHVPVVQDELRR